MRRHRGIIGPGKSLLLRMIADLDPNEGEVWLDGRARRSFTAAAWRRRVVSSAAEPGWWHNTAAPHFPKGAALDTARMLMPRLSLAPALLESPIVRLSTGERQRLALIRALALDPPVHLLDEPTGPLDQDATARVEDLLRERLGAGATIVIVTPQSGASGPLRPTAVPHAATSAGSCLTRRCRGNSDRGGRSTRPWPAIMPDHLTTGDARERGDGTGARDQ